MLTPPKFPNIHDVKNIPHTCSEIWGRFYPINSYSHQYIKDTKQIFDDITDNNTDWSYPPYNQNYMDRNIRHFIDKRGRLKMLEWDETWKFLSCKKHITSTNINYCFTMLDKEYIFIVSESLGDHK